MEWSKRYYIFLVNTDLPLKILTLVYVKNCINFIIASYSFTEVTSSMFSRSVNISISSFRLNCSLSQLNRLSSTALQRKHHFLTATFKTSHHSPCHSFNGPSFVLSSRFSQSPPSMDLKTVLEVLEQLAPLSLAESWDNVGLLVEPSKQRPVKTILLTNDLTADVMDEAEAMTCDLIISYHPPLFRPFKRLVQKDWKQQLAIRAIESGIAVFSPHTSWDSVKDGLNDWLIEGVGWLFRFRSNPGYITTICFGYFY